MKTSQVLSAMLLVVMFPLLIYRTYRATHRDEIRAEQATQIKEQFNEIATSCYRAKLYKKEELLTVINDSTLPKVKRSEALDGLIRLSDSLFAELTLKMINTPEGKERLDEMDKIMEAKCYELIEKAHTSGERMSQ